jgi:hypothetical protein
MYDIKTRKVFHKKSVFDEQELAMRINTNSKPQKDKNELTMNKYDAKD